VRRYNRQLTRDAAWAHETEVWVVEGEIVARLLSPSLRALGGQNVWREDEGGWVGAVGRLEDHPELTAQLDQSGTGQEGGTLGSIILMKKRMVHCQSSLRDAAGPHTEQVLSKKLAHLIVTRDGLNHIALVILDVPHVQLWVMRCVMLVHRGLDCRQVGLLGHRAGKHEVRGDGRGAEGLVLLPVLLLACRSREEDGLSLIRRGGALRIACNHHHLHSHAALQ
jgi:hypothetical protein